VFFTYRRIDTRRVVGEVLDLKKPITNVVNQVLGDTWIQSRDITFKSYTSYRRVHEVLSAIIDEALRGGSLETIQTGLARALILIKYQNAREQLSDKIAELLSILIIEISQRLNRSDIKQLLERVRIFLDALVTLAYIKAP